MTVAGCCRLGAKWERFAELYRKALSLWIFRLSNIKKLMHVLETDFARGLYMNLLGKNDLEFAKSS